MNRYDELYYFRLAKIDDVDGIMKFIHDEWNKEHILAHNKEFFLWQYGRSEYDDYENINFVIMEDKENNILGLIGFIAYSNDKERLHISQAITKIKPYGMLPMSGVELMKRQIQLVGEKIQFASGVNPTTIKPIFDRVFYNEVGTMQQFYMLNKEICDYRIAVIKDRQYLTPSNSNYKLLEIDRLDKVSFDYNVNYDRMSYKSYEFINKRYFKHPIYKYKSWSLVDEQNQCKGLLFAREIEHNNSRILRIVDYRGDLSGLYGIGSEIYKIMIDSKYEYVDIMVSGLDETKMRSCGFNLLDVDGENIIPNYFEPFEQRNIRNNYYKSGDIVIFKADGDQDRPNRLP